MVFLLTEVPSYKYAPDSLRNAMFPPLIVSKSDPFERPRKKRKVDRQSPPEKSDNTFREVEIELTSGEILYFVPHHATNGGGSTVEAIKQELKWTLVRCPSRESLTRANDIGAQMDDGNVLVRNCTLANLEFESTYVSVWDANVSKSDLPLGTKSLSQSGKGNGLSLPIRIWHWRSTSPNDNLDS